MRFVDRDLNVAANILLVGKTLPARPEALRRKERRLDKRGKEEDEEKESAIPTKKQFLLSDNRVTHRYSATKLW